MKKKNILIMLALMVVAAAGVVSCVKQYTINVSTNELWFGLEAGSQELKITADCKWTISKNEVADWYTISAMSGGENDSIIVITVDPLEDADFRGASFVILSPGGHVYRTVFVSQNKLDFDGMVNKVFGVTFLEHWNTDYFGQMIEDSYKFREYDPYDTSRGYIMYFLEDGQGIQRDHHKDTAVYYAFSYEYNPVNQILHIEFVTVSDTILENYDAQVLTASDSLYRFIHEYKPNWWERADLRKIGTINPSEKSLLMRATKKRKEAEGIFRF